MKRKSSSSPSPRPKKRKKKKSGRRRSRWVERASCDNVFFFLNTDHTTLHCGWVKSSSNYRDLNIGMEPSDPEVGEWIKNSKRNGTWRRRKRCIGAKQIRRELLRDLRGDLLCYCCYCYTRMPTAIRAHGEKWNSEFKSCILQLQNAKCFPCLHQQFWQLLTHAQREEEEEREETQARQVQTMRDMLFQSFVNSCEHSDGRGSDAVDSEERKNGMYITEREGMIFSICVMRQPLLTLWIIQSLRISLPQQKDLLKSNVCKFLWTLPKFNGSFLVQSL